MSNSSAVDLSSADNLRSHFVDLIKQQKLVFEQQKKFLQMLSDASKKAAERPSQPQAPQPQPTMSPQQPPQQPSQQPPQQQHRPGMFVRQPEAANGCLLRTNGPRSCGYKTGSAGHGAGYRQPKFQARRSRPRFFRRRFHEPLAPRFSRHASGRMYAPAINASAPSSSNAQAPEPVPELELAKPERYEVFVTAVVNELLEVDFLVDTGAAANFLSKSVWENLVSKHEIRPTEKSATTLDGTPIQLDGEINMLIELGPYQAEVEFLLCSKRDCHSVLGLEFLQGHCENLDFSLSTLALNDGSCVMLQYAYELRSRLANCTEEEGPNYDAAVEHNSPESAEEIDDETDM